MELFLCLAVLLAGGAGGYLLGRAAPDIRKARNSFTRAGENPAGLQADGHPPLLERQYQNFLSYDGTERGQHDFENRN